MKRLIYTLCLIIGCATLSEAKVLTGHKIPANRQLAVSAGRHRQYLGSSASRRSRQFGMRSPYGRLSPCPIASMPQMP